MRDLPENEYRVFSLDPEVRCAFCAFKGKRLNVSNFVCVRHNDITNAFATCNRFKKDNPQKGDEDDEDR